MTLLLHDETFIKWKPTLVNWGFALAFWGSHYIGEKPIIRRMLGEAIHLPDAVWTRLSILWIVFFIFSGAANLFVAYTFDTDTWVNFKLFGLMGMTLVFMVLQGLYLAKYMQNDKKEQD